MQTSTIQITPAKHSRKLVCFNGSVDSTVALQEALRTHDVDLLIITGPDWGVNGVAWDDPKNIMPHLNTLLWVLNEGSVFQIKDIFFYQHIEPYIVKKSLESFMEYRPGRNEDGRHQTMRIMTILQTAAQVVNDSHYSVVLSIYVGEKHAVSAGLYNQTFDMLRRFRQTFPIAMEFPLLNKTGADVLDLLHPINGVVARSVSGERNSNLPEMAIFEWERYMSKEYPEFGIQSYESEFQDAIGRYSNLKMQQKMLHFQQWKGLSFEIAKLRGGNA